MLRNLIIATYRLLAAANSGVRLILLGHVCRRVSTGGASAECGTRAMAAILTLLAQCLRSFFPALAQEHPSMLTGRLTKRSPAVVAPIPSAGRGIRALVARRPVASLQAATKFCSPVTRLWAMDRNRSRAERARNRNAPDVDVVKELWGRSLPYPRLVQGLRDPAIKHSVFEAVTPHSQRAPRLHSGQLPKRYICWTGGI